MGAPDARPKAVVKVPEVKVVPAIEAGEAASPLPGTDCPLAPSWTRLKPCLDKGWSYAQGEAPVGINPSLARSRAGLQARWALAEALGLVREHRAQLSGAEVPELYACEGTMYALARMKTSDVGTLPSCGTTLDSHAVPAEGCPVWTRGLAWSEADGLVGIAQVDAIKSPSLARSSVLGRARHAASQLIVMKLDERDGKLSTFTASRPLVTLNEAVVQCAGAFWGRVTIAPPKH